MTDPFRHRGFTLVELVITMVIVSIFAAIAIPSYSAYVLRANRAVIRPVLVDLAAKQDVQKLQTRSFALDFSPFVPGATATVYIDGKGGMTAAATANSRYKISFDGTPTATSYTLSAEAAGKQLKDTDCAKLTLSSAGVRSAHNSMGASNPDCWGK